MAAANRKAPPPIELAQVQKIHALVAALKMSDPDYREMLAAGFRGVTTCKDLDAVEAAGLILGLEDQAVRVGVWKRYPVRHGPRVETQPGKASSKQLWKIRDLWARVARAEPEKREEALNHFLQRRFKISRVEWLDMKKASSVIVTLDAMARSQDARKAA